MKKTSFFCLFGCMLLLSYCTKPYIDFPHDGDHDKDKEKEFTLKRMVYHFTNAQGDYHVFTYDFYFNNKRQLDSIIMDPQVVGGYAIFRSRNRIDSVVQTLFGSYSYGLPIIWRTGFEYDKHGNFTRFNIISLQSGLQRPVVITYDRGHVYTTTHYNTSNPSLPIYDTFTYVKNDVVRWSTVSPGATPNKRRYTYDHNHYNPLYYFADDLLAIFSGSRFEWEFFVSEHVSTSKFYEQSQQLVTYGNFYDRKGRLIKKVFTEPIYTQPDSLTFEYVK